MSTPQGFQIRISKGRAKVGDGGKYDANELLRDIKEEEVIRIEFHICCCTSAYIYLTWMDMYLQVILILHPRDHEIMYSTVREFMATDEFCHMYNHVS